MDKKKYTYYIYYFRTTKELYAYTDDKTTRDLFISMRDVEHVLYEKKAGLSKQEVGSLALDYQRNRLSLKSLTTYDWDKEKEKKVVVAITDIEFSSLQNMITRMISVDLFLYTWVPDRFFVKKLRDLLYVFNYKWFNSVVDSPKRGTPRLNDKKQGIMGDFLSYIDIFEIYHVDELAMFLKQFAYTFS